MRPIASSSRPMSVRCVNEHCAYPDLPKADRHALRDILAAAFPIGKSANELWSDFPDTTAFLRRIVDDDSGLPGGVVGAAIVMSYPSEQYDYLAYFAIHPDHRHRRRFFSRADGPHHGTALLRYIYDVMWARVSPTNLQSYLMIEPAGEDALRFYLHALPANVYPLKFYAEDWVISVGYDGFAL